MGSPAMNPADKRWDPSRSDVCARFEAAWRSASAGFPPPQLDSYLLEVPESERPDARRALESIEQAYRDSLARRSAGEERVAAAATAGDFAQGRDTPGSASEARGAAATVGATVAAQESHTLAGGDQHSLSGTERLSGPAGAWLEFPGYEIAGELGRGGMGVVYKALQKGLGRWVALKMVLAGSHASPQQLARFRAEASAVARLQHPNIVQIYDVGERNGLPYFSLEFVEGGTLQQRIHGNPQPPREAAYLVETLARAVAYAHQLGIVHRDLKPANVLLTRDGVPKITDFGVAKRLEDSSGQTKSGMLVGTPSYMAPEQARAEASAVGPLVDVYALGAILYELLTGRPPFEAATTMDTIVKVTSQEAVAPSRLRYGLPPDLETICLKCLQKEPEPRYQSAQALAEDLRRFLAGEPIQARPVGSAERAWRWCKRNPRLAALGGVALALLVGWAVSSTFLYYQILAKEAAKEREYQRAESNREQAEENARREGIARREAEARRLEAQAAEQKAAERAGVAERQRTIMLGSLYGMITKVEDKLRDKEDMSDLRKGLLETGMDGLRQVEQAFGKSTLVDRSMGVAYQRLGDIYESVGKTDETMRLYKQSLVVFERLEKEEPDNDWLPWNRAISYDRLGSVSHDFQGDAAAALDYYRKSLALRQALAARVKTPEIKPARRNAALSVSYIKLASFTRDVGDPAAAREFARQALAQSEAALAADPKDAQSARFRATSRYTLGRAEAHLGLVAEARTTLRRCIEEREKFARDDPTSAAAKRDLGAAYEALGDLELEQGAVTTARDAYAKAQALHRALVEKERDNLEDQWNLGNAYYRLGTALEMLGERAAARTHFAECLKLREVRAKADPTNVQAQAEFMLAQARAGRRAEAARSADAVRDRSAKDPAYLFETARAYALCAGAAGNDKALQGRYSALAIGCLERALALGYRDRDALLREPDLEPIRTSPAYQTLLGKLPIPKP
jgi:serine/threonine-protein kinase